MALFLMNRYEGADEVSERDKKNQADLILKKLHSFANQKKQQAMKTDSISSAKDLSAKSSGSFTIGSDNQSAFESIIDESSPAKKKKKGKKLKEKANIETECDVNTLSENESLDHDTNCNVEGKVTKKKFKRKETSQKNVSLTEGKVEDSMKCADEVPVRKSRKRKISSEKSEIVGNESSKRVSISSPIVAKRRKKSSDTDGAVEDLTLNLSLEKSAIISMKRSRDIGSDSNVDAVEMVKKGHESHQEDDDDDDDDDEDDDDDDDDDDNDDTENIQDQPESETTHDQSKQDTDGPEDFTVLGRVREKRLEKLKYKLPEWLAHPVVMLSNLRKGGVALDDVTCLDEDLLATLREDGVDRLFPVQEHLIPAILTWCRPSYSSGLLGHRPRDICCSSPTGSGKTLAFALPIVQALKSRLVPRVRALVVLPVRDLAKQVHKVLVQLCRKTELKVGLVVGQKSLSQEQSALVRKDDFTGEMVSLVDILVATPGRLVDHVQKTEGFDLGFLRFIVIDEADRVLDEIKQDWLNHVTDAVNRHHGNNVFSQPLTLHNISKHIIPPQKLLFSATLTQNPEKLQQLNLFQPQLFTSVVQLNPDDKAVIPEQTEGDFVGKYTTPAGLTEYYIECTPQQRPLLVLHYLHNLRFKQVLCFTNSVESTHRLASLVNLFGGGINVCEFSSKMDASKRAKMIKKFAEGDIHMIVCSDAMARGMDIDNVKYIISYELPVKIKTYIHRVGRTARAGRAGTAITLLEKKEVYAFKKMLKTSGKTDVREERLRPSVFKNIVPQYKEALEQLPQILRMEGLKKSSKKR